MKAVRDFLHQLSKQIVHQSWKFEKIYTKGKNKNMDILQEKLRGEERVMKMVKIQLSEESVNWRVMFELEKDD